MTALEVRGVSKNYPLSSSQWARFRHVFAPGSVRYEHGAWALRDVTFSVAKGEAFGIVGANGSGKSTLLQIVAGILQPTRGEVEVNGRLAALLELGSGFAPEFSGRENVRLNASLLGLDREQLDARFEAIERFAAIGDFIDQPVRTYSSGMVLRLAFAVVAHVDPEILIVDEALAVGDIAFRQRCMRRIHDLRAAGTTILYVSHDTGDVKALCDRCLWLEQGAVRALGEADEVVGDYLSAMLHRGTVRDAETRVEHHAPSPEVVNSIAGTHRFGNRRALISGAELVGEWTARSAVILRVSFRVCEPLPLPIVGFLVRNEKGETIFGSNTGRENYPLPGMAPGDLHTVDFHWNMPSLTGGRYLISVAVSEGTIEEFAVCDYVEDAIAIGSAEAGDKATGYLHLTCSGVSVYSES